MHPPFYVVDHKIGPDIHPPCDAPRILRRNKPAVLDLTPVANGWPPVPLVPAQPAQALPQPPMLRIVPPPDRTIRHIVGRLLIRAGQRLIL